MSGEIVVFAKCRVRLIIAAGICVLSGIIAINMLLVQAPVVIELEGDSFRVIEIPYTYTTGDAYVLLLAGFLCGITLSYMLYCLMPARQAVPDSPSLPGSPSAEPGNEDRAEVCGTEVCSGADLLLRVLEGDEKRTVELIAGNGGRILQNELVNSLDFSKAKVSRILMNLEKRKIIEKRKYGLTNCISLADDIRGEVK
jgi:hypothetical protein